MTMTCYTPEFYLRFSKSEGAEAARLDQEWEDREAALWAELMTFVDRMPLELRKLAEEITFHDAEVLGWQSIPSKFAGRATLTNNGTQTVYAGRFELELKLGNSLYLVTYSLCAPVRELPAPENWPYPSQPLDWLYSEFHEIPGGFEERILLSDGRVLEIPCFQVHLDHNQLAPETSLSGV